MRRIYICPSQKQHNHLIQNQLYLTVRLNSIIKKLTHLQSTEKGTWCAHLHYKICLLWYWAFIMKYTLCQQSLAITSLLLRECQIKFLLGSVDGNFYMSISFQSKPIDAVAATVIFSKEKYFMVEKGFNPQSTLRELVLTPFIWHLLYNIIILTWCISTRIVNYPRW